jgi:hypothetical protein
MGRALAQLREQHRQHERAVARWEALRDQLPETLDRAPDGLTMCSVAYRGKRYLELNDRLMRQLNPDTPRPPWLLFDNNVEAGEMIGCDDTRFTVVRPPGRDSDMGYEHALGISALLARVKTRFVLIQDPDCFIVAPDWIPTVPRYMDQHGLGFFGTPVNPRRHNSYRYFPYMVCLFVDLARVSPRDLCFLPDVWRFATNLTYRMRRAPTRIPKAGYLFRWLLTEQYKTNGWRIKQKFGRGDLVRSECAQPVWDVEAAAGRRSLKGLIHALTPGSVSPIPKRPGYCAPHGFASRGAPDVSAFGWEEFMWRDQPFAFHVGSVHAAAAGSHPQLANVLDAFARRSRGPAVDPALTSVGAGAQAWE